MNQRATSRSRTKLSRRRLLARARGADRRAHQPDLAPGDRFGADAARPRPSASSACSRPTARSLRRSFRRAARRSAARPCGTILAPLADAQGQDAGAQGRAHDARPTCRQARRPAHEGPGRDAHRRHAARGQLHRLRAAPPATPTASRSTSSSPTASAASTRISVARVRRAHRGAGAAARHLLPRREPAQHRGRRPVEDVQPHLRRTPTCRTRSSRAALAERKSVLDFLKDDISRLRGARQRRGQGAARRAPRTASRSIEQQLDDTATQSCTPPDAAGASIDPRAMANFPTIASADGPDAARARPAVSRTSSTFMWANADSWQYYPWTGRERRAPHALARGRQRHRQRPTSSSRSTSGTPSRWPTFSTSSPRCPRSAAARCSTTRVLLWGNELGVGNNHTYTEHPLGARRRQRGWIQFGRYISIQGSVPQQPTGFDRPRHGHVRHDDVRHPRAVHRAALGITG